MSLLARADIEYYDASDVPSVVSGTTISQSINIAVLTVLLYDAVTTMDKEVRYFWNSLRNTINIVYFANKYIGILGAATRVVGSSYNLDVAGCKDIFPSFLIENCIDQCFAGKYAAWFESLSVCCTIVVVDYILMIRVLAFYAGDKKVSVFLHALLGISAVSRTSVVIYMLIEEKVTVLGLAENLTTCGADGLVPIAFGYADWLIPVGYGFVLMVLALYRAAEYWRLSAGFKGLPLVKVLIEDQIIYFFAAIMICVMSVVSFNVVAVIPFSIITAISNPSFLCILGTRMLINAKEAAALGMNEGTSYRMTSRTLSQVEFAA